MLNSPRDKNEGTYCRRRAHYVTPDLSYYWEQGGREYCEDNKWDGGKKNETLNSLFCDHRTLLWR